MTWQRGRADVAALLSSGALVLVAGAAADGTPLLTSAEALMESARRELPHNPEAAFVLAYDAARKACAAVLAQQGLRTRSQGHHVTTEQVVRAQFGRPFEGFAGLRRRRAEIQYPQGPTDTVTTGEAEQAIDKAGAILDAAELLLPTLPMFRAG